MAESKYEVVKVVNHGEWLKGCPLFVVRSQIIKDASADKLYVVNEMANVGMKDIKSVVVKIECFDDTNKLISSVDNCAYQNVNITKQAVFGANKLFAIADGTSEVSVIIKSVTYADDLVWNNDYLHRGIKIENPVKIDPNDSVYDVVETRCKDNQITPKFWPSEFVGGWRCTCAQINDEDNLACSLCGASKFWVLDNLNREDIVEYKERVEREIRLRVEREAQERRLAAERAAEEARLVAQKEEEERLRAEEEARLAAEREEQERLRAEEEARLAAERAAEEERLAAERAAEEARLAEIRAIEEAKRIEAEKKAAEERARLELLMAKKEAVRQYNMKQSQKSVQKKFTWAIVAVVAAVAVFGIFKFVQWMRIDERYNSAEQYVKAYEYEKAISVYQSLGDYKDSSEMVLETKYQYADYLSVIDRYADSIALYEQLGAYKDSKKLIQTVYLKWGNYARENKQYADAFTYYENAGSLVDKQTLADTSYEYAQSLYEEGKYQEAIEMFGKAGSRAGIQGDIAKCYSAWGETNLNQGRFDEAINCFTHSYNVEDTNDLNKKAYYLKGNKLLASNDIEGAYNCYINAMDYDDAKDKRASLIPDMIDIYIKDKNYNAAMLLISEVEIPEDKKESTDAAKYAFAEFMLTQSVDERILEIYKSLPKNYEQSKERIEVIEDYINYVGKYVSSNENAAKKEVIVNMTVVDGEVVLRANGELIDLDDMSSDNCKLNKRGSLSYTIDGTTYTYKK